MLTASTYIVDMFQYIVTDTGTRYGYGILYLHGHPIEIFERMADMANTQAQDQNRFPLIALFQDFEERKGLRRGVLSEITIPSIIIANATVPTYNSTERYTNNFKSILYPIYASFMEAIARSGYAEQSTAETIQHTKIDRLYWGKTGTYGNTANIFNDYIDAIEIKNLQLTVLRKNTCSTNNI